MKKILKMMAASALTLLIIAGNFTTNSHAFVLNPYGGPEISEVNPDIFQKMAEYEYYFMTARIERNNGTGWVSSIVYSFTAFDIFGPDEYPNECIFLFDTDSFTYNDEGQITASVSAPIMYASGDGRYGWNSMSGKGVKRAMTYSIAFAQSDGHVTGEHLNENAEISFTGKNPGAFGYNDTIPKYPLTIAGEKGADGSLALYTNIPIFKDNASAIKYMKDKDTSGEVVNYAKIVQDSNSSAVVKSDCGSEVTAYIPKKIVLSDDANTFITKVTGDLSSGKNVEIKTSAESIVFTDESGRKTVSVPITADKTLWTFQNVADEVSSVYNMNATFDGFTAGKWSAQIPFTIKIINAKQE